MWLKGKIGYESILWCSESRRCMIERVCGLGGRLAVKLVVKCVQKACSREEDFLSTSCAFLKLA